MNLVRALTASLAMSTGLLLLPVGAPGLLLAQASPQAAHAPLDQVLGTVTAVNAADKTFTVKQDKTGTEYSVSAANARRFLKVPPGQKDLKKAQPITAGQIAVGDRLLARGHKDASAPKLDAEIVLVMTSGDLQQKHQAELEDWQKRGSRGTITAIDDATHSVVMSARTPEGTKTVTVTTTPETQFTRYASASAKYSDAKPSSFSELKPGDELRVLGNSTNGGADVAAEQVISGAFKTIAATIVSINPDGKQLQVTDLQTKQPVTVALTDDSSVRRLPPMMANRLARRLNANYKPQGGATEANGETPPAGGSERSGAHDGNMEQPANPNAPAGEGARPNRGGFSGDLSKDVEQLPKIPASDLKPGDAVVISGGVGDDKSHLTAINIIAGVEPLFASAPSKAGRSAALGMWNLDVGTPGEDSGGAGGDSPNK
ncbi:MAG TPA: DUF5666 domain-containing protein [Bryobacteraceae bacterium]|nr:DUF5666 domain-containing protein [Bryobacteraceae bacterium]